VAFVAAAPTGGELSGVIFDGLPFQAAG
jgi:hypothetical protein